MRSFTLLSLLCTLFVLATLSAAWQWPPDAGNGEDDGYVAKRAAAASTATATQATETGSSSTTTDSAAATTGSAATTSGSSASESGSSASESGSSTKESGKSKGTKTSTTSSSIFVDPRLPPGGISMINPATTTTTYYKIGDYVTFAWNYTSLSVTPSAIDVVAYCSSNSATYTLASNMSVSSTNAVTWDTHQYQATATVPLLTASYTLIVYEAGTNPSDVASAGHLGASNFLFGMYVPQPYTPLQDGYQCVTCNAALSDTERQALGFMLTMATITVLSFTWFASGFGFFSS